MNVDMDGMYDNPTAERQSAAKGPSCKCVELLRVEDDAEVSLTGVPYQA
jgi:hypothetical protein